MDFSFSDLNYNSVETLPGFEARAAFTVNSASVFREDVDIVPTIVDDTLSYIPWGGDNQMPFDLLALVEKDETLATCQCFNAEVCYGSGLQYCAKEATASVKSAVEDFLLDNDLAAYFLESLMDMDKDAKSFSEDFSEYMQRALLNFSMGELFDDELREWYNGIAELMKEQGGKLTKQQIEDARKEYDSMVQKAMNERDKISEITGYTGSSSSSSQEASKKGFAAASQDSIDELNGRFTALQIAGEEIKNQSVTQSQSLNILTMKADTLISINTETRNIADDTRDLIASSYLELVQISENTGAIIKPIQQMQKDISEVKNNTKGLSTK